MSVPRASSNALLSTCGFVCLLLVGLGCGDSAECVVDTDCELGNRCEAQACVPVGFVPETDAGPDQDSAAEEDAGGAADAAQSDVGPEEDAGFDAGADSGSDTDAGPTACDFDGTYSVVLDAGSAPGCSTDVSTCSFATVGAFTTVDCGTFSYDCLYDEDCQCASTGVAVMGGSGNVAADPTNSSLAVSGAFGTCTYTLMAD